MKSINPATDEVIWEGKETTVTELSRILKKAKSAQLEWQSTPLDTRISIMETYKKVLETHKESLATWIMEDTGKALWETRLEVSAMINKVDISIEAFYERCPQKEIEAAPLSWELRHKPHGILAVFGPFNFPCHLPNGHILPALIAGNAVVFKPSEHTPYVSEKWIELWRSLPIPEGLLTLVQGGKSLGKRITQAPEINGILFTGSYKTGLSLHKQFSETMEKILALELGGNNPIILSQISDIKAAAYLLLLSSFITTGQRCTCSRRIIVLNTPKNKQVIDAFISTAKSLSIGDPRLEKEIFMGPLIHKHAATAILQHQKSLHSQGARSVLTARHLPNHPPAFLSPGIVELNQRSKVPDVEVFGPLTHLIWVNSLEEAITVAESTKYGLAASILTDDKSEFETFFRHSRSGLINWNQPTTGASSKLPFGGTGHSGNHRPSAYYAADYCAYPVASTLSERCILPQTLAPGVSDALL